MELEKIISFLIVLGVLAGVVLLIAFVKRFKRCPPDQVMVISGRVGKGPDGKPRSSLCLHGGAKFVIPLIQEVRFLDLTPFTIQIDLKGALSKQNIRVNVPATFTIGISTEPAIMQKAAERLLGKDLKIVKDIAEDIIYGQLRLVIAQLDIEELNSKREEFMEMVSQNIESELSKIGLKLINANITDISDESGYIAALGQKAEAKALNDAKRDTAFHTREGNVAIKEEQLQEQKSISLKDREQREFVAIQRNEAETAETKANENAKAIQAEIAKENSIKITQANAEREAVEQETARDKRSRVSKAQAEAEANEALNRANSEAAKKDAEKALRKKVADANAEAEASEAQARANTEAAQAQAAANAQAAKKDAEKALRMKVATANADAEAAEKEAEKVKRTKIAASTAQAVAAENDAKAQIALSEAKRLEIEAQARARAVAADKVQNAKALSEAYAAEEKAEIARAARIKAALQADILIKEEIERQRLAIAAEAEAEAIRRKAKGEADAILARMEAEAEGMKLQLAKRAEAYAMYVDAAGGNPDSAVKIMMADKAEDLVKAQVEAIKGINIDKITVWDSVNGDGSSTTSNFVKSLMKAVPPIKDVFDMIGVGSDKSDKSDDKKDDSDNK